MIEKQQLLQDLRIIKVALELINRTNFYDQEIDEMHTTLKDIAHDSLGIGRNEWSLPYSYRNRIDSLISTVSSFSNSYGIIEPLSDFDINLTNISQIIDSVDSAITSVSEEL